MKKLMVATLAFALLATAAPVFAENQSGSMKRERTEKQYDLPCVQSAVATREAAIQKSWTNYTSAISSALSARASALNTAWGNSDGPARRTARKAAWENYRTANKSAREAFRSDKKSAWESFKTASAACKVPLVETEESDQL